VSGPLTFVVPALVAGIHVLLSSSGYKRGRPGHRQVEATAFFEPLYPAMTAVSVARDDEGSQAEQRV